MIVDRVRLKAYRITWDVADPLALLDSLQGQPRWAWLDVEQTLIAWGVAAALQGPDLEAQLDPLRWNFPQEGVRLFGGLPFDGTGASDALWGAFATSSFILPRYIYSQTSDGGWLTIIHPEHLNPVIPTPWRQRWQPTSLPAAHLEQPLSYPQWEAMVETVRRQAASGRIQKVVLARALTATFEHTPSLVTVFARLAHRYPDTYRFYYEPLPGRVLQGATPELLVRTRGRQLETVALAGSAPRGETPVEDRRLGEALLTSPKDRREQAIVVEHICDDLRPLCASLQYSEEPRLRRLSNIQHLETPIAARLKRPGIFAPARALHPTPALAGQPRQAALKMIRQYEPLPRGCYGAPVGWITPEGDGVLAVAIRSAAFRENVGRLYAGAGILAESQPGKEWQETSLKFRPLLDALDLAEAKQ